MVTYHQGNLSEHGLAPIQETQLKHKGMECLVSVLKCLVEWSKDLYKRPHIPSEEKTGLCRSFYSRVAGRCDVIYAI